MKLPGIGKVVLFGLVLGLLASRAQAVAVTDVTFRILPGDYINASAAELLADNDSESNVNDLEGSFEGDPWAPLDKTDGPSTSFMGVTFTLTATPDDAPSGTWGLSWATTGLPGLPLTMDFVFVTKAANNWGAYLFTDLDLTAANSPGDGRFQIAWTNQGGNTPGLSHASIYGRGTSTPDDPDEPDDPSNGVPVPGTLLLLGLGLLGLGCSRKRQAHS